MINVQTIIVFAFSLFDFYINISERSVFYFLYSSRIKIVCR